MTFSDNELASPVVQQAINAGHSSKLEVHVDTLSCLCPDAIGCRISIMGGPFVDCKNRLLVYRASGSCGRRGVLVSGFDVPEE